MRGATPATVTEAMGAEGVEHDKNARHFLSHYAHGEGGSGDINFRFNEQGRADLIFGVIDKSQTETSFAFIWNAERLPNGCSDMPNTRMMRCDFKKDMARALWWSGADALSEPLSPATRGETTTRGAKYKNKPPHAAQ